MPKRVTRSRRMGRLLSVLLGLLGFARTVDAQSRPYDDFTSGLLSPIKWRGHQVGDGVQETVRQVQGNALVLRHRVLGNHQISTGTNDSRNQLLFHTGPGQQFTTLRLRLRVEDVTVVGCAEGEPSRVYAGFFGNLMTDTQGDFIGVFLLVDRRSSSEEAPDVLHVRAGIVRCPGGECTDVVHDADEDLGVVRVGQDVTLRMTWEGSRVRFRKDAEPAVTVRLKEPLAQRLSGRVLEVSGFAANCPSAPETEAAMKARIDRIFIAP